MGKGHVILGETSDYLSGQTITETHDEQARQRVARCLVEEKGFSKDEIASRITLPVSVDGKSGNSRIDFAIRINGSVYAIVVYGPGSLVSRQNPAIAAACLIEPFLVPVAIVTNGIDAHVLNTQTGKVVGEGLAAIPSRASAIEQMQRLQLAPVSENRRNKARRILYAMDILAAKECDDACELCE